MGVGVEAQEVQECFSPFAVESRSRDVGPAGPGQDHLQGRGSVQLAQCCYRCWRGQERLRWCWAGVLPCAFPASFSSQLLNQLVHSGPVPPSLSGTVVLQCLNPDLPGIETVHPTFAGA